VSFDQTQQIYAKEEKRRVTVMLMLSRKTRCQLLLLVFLLLTAGGLIPRAQVPLEVGRRDWAKALPDGEGKALVLATCTQCHSLTPIALQRKPAKAWQLLVDDMIMRGAQIQVAEVNPITNYLIRTFGPDAAPLSLSEEQRSQPASPTQGAVTSGQALPEGAGKDVILRSCTSCHALNKTTEARKDADGWRANVKDMIRLGARVTPEEETIVVAYLTKNFPRETSTSPVAVTNTDVSKVSPGSYGMGRTTGTTPAHLFPDDEGKALILASCVQCHATLSYLLQIRKTEVGWRHSVEDMVARGAQVTPAESEIIIRYLSKHMPATKKTE
jgi:cytochrome c5